MTTTVSAFFNVESGINLANGKFAEDGTIFNRKALVGLRSRDFGSVSFGRQSDMVVDFVAPFSQVARYARTMGGARYDLNNLALLKTQWVMRLSGHTR
ncbi:porin [Robbsia andropogonis]|uniref:porin n=1 Tax=Robbsia andropogonis TaxID=28092 RepID=UPI003D249758